MAKKLQAASQKLQAEFGNRVAEHRWLEAWAVSL
jgi:hypothetical protein